ncbi:hypothetical protein AJ78_08134 [Emergomyces pasteurianus Ep9510]|uniref:Uncharacterized protein n=1 Tax=Emergomyces pasteurianus Ep9510 TaxID=1447872 RepID=A0A1J9Q503_9EURO|nr:hypothetical protein AJ78_08134 [Emergomyces pasteurianus Ep9510]
MAQQYAPHSDSAALETPRVPTRLLSITALARFEFEPGKGNEGTKILMVEWEDDDLTRSSGTWHVSWNGKQTVLPADEQTSDHVRRCYFLLPPGTTIPPVITLAYEPPPSSAATVKKPDSVQVNPLPAIFPPELGATARAAGKKGVLHTIWAKKRLQALEKEIKEESRYNLEGVALEMALQEKEWIETNFGVGPRLAPLQTTNVSSLNAVPLSPTTPLSPGGGRKLSEKLKGLKLGTSEKDLTRKAPPANQAEDSESHPLSPEGPDVAISSFKSFHHTPISDPAKSPVRHTVAHLPPAYIQAQQQQPMSEGGFTSLITPKIDQNTDDGLFAKALSPRSPDIPRSPFSFSPEETIPYAKMKLNES